jgi:hypothetical protein
MEIFNYGCLAMAAFGQTRHIAPSLRLFVPNGLTEYNNPFLLDLSVVQSLRRLISSCSRCSSVVQSWWLLISSCSRCSFLKTVRPERCLDEVRAGSVYQSIFILRVAGVSMFRSLRCLQFLLALGRWPDLPKCPVDYLLYSIRRQACDLPVSGLPQCPVGCLYRPHI